MKSYNLSSFIINQTSGNAHCNSRNIFHVKGKDFYQEFEY